MTNRFPLTAGEKARIFEGKLQGQSLAELATMLDCTPSCARKWWRRAHAQGTEGLCERRRGRGRKGCLSQFDPRIAEQALALKRRHPRWGAQRVRVELGQDAALNGMRLPQRSRLATFFKQFCPECVKVYKVRLPPARRDPDVTGVHEMWQIDCQEGVALAGGFWATVCNIRDPVGAAMIASQAFEVTTPKHWRKLDWTEFRQVLRNAFTEWGTLPDGVQSDNELGLAGGPNDPFPGRLTLWLVGLGIRHRLIRPGHPTDQPQIERNHRTLADLVSTPEALHGLEALQQALDRERHLYNRLFPCQASDCAGQPPLRAHPELLQPRRPYRPEAEWQLFSLQRVYDYLAEGEFQRKVSSVGRASLGRVFYSLSRSRAGQSVKARMDPQRQEWVFYAEGGEEITRLHAKQLSIQDLTGLDPTPSPLPAPVQLTLPCFV